MDLFGKINGDSQLVNLAYNLGTNQIIYMAFYNLDLPTRVVDKNYELTIHALPVFGYLCFTCPAGTSFAGACQCWPCSANHYGKRCNYYVKTM